MNDKSFNPNVRAKYLENPDGCPNCGKENNVTACDFECDTRMAYRDIVCNSCKLVLKLLNVKNIFSLEKKK